jgi:hypothetical protein
MRRSPGGGSVRHMPLWVLTIVICAAVWVVGSLLVAFGARWLVHHEPH